MGFLADYNIMPEELDDASFLSFAREHYERERGAKKKAVQASLFGECDE